MNNKKLFDYIDQYGGDSNNFIKIDNLDSMMDFESSDVKDNTEDYTISLLDKILSNGSTNDNEDNNQLSDISGGSISSIRSITPAGFAFNLAKKVGPGAKKLAENAVSQASKSVKQSVIQSVNKSVDHSGDHQVDTSKNIDRTTSVKKNKSKTEHKHNKHSVETEHKHNGKKHNKYPVETDHKKMLENLDMLKQQILDSLNDDDKQNIISTEEHLTLDDMMEKLEQMKKQLNNN
jgi:hypothetical protein